MEHITQAKLDVGPQPLVEDKPKPHLNHETSEKISAVKMIKVPNARTDSKVYMSYFTAVGGLGFTLVHILGLITKQALTALTTRLLGRTNLRRPIIVIYPSIQDLGSNLQRYVYLYLLTSILAIVFEYLFNVHVYSGSLRASWTLFRKTAFTVMRMSLLWLDTMPMGELLKRFTVDSR